MSSKEPDNNERSNVAQKPVEAPSKSGQDRCFCSKSFLAGDKESSRTAALSVPAVCRKQILNYFLRRGGDAVDEVELLSRGRKEMYLELLRGTVWWIEDGEQSAILEATQMRSRLATVLCMRWLIFCLSIADLGSAVRLSQGACSCSTSHRMDASVSSQNVAFVRYGARLYVPKYSLWQKTHVSKLGSQRLGHAAQAGIYISKRACTRDSLLFISTPNMRHAFQHVT